MSAQAASDLARIRSERPLVHNITNYVVMNTTANALLAIGASAVMAQATEEVEEMVAIAQALVLNIGTLSEEWIAAMLTAGRKARQKGIPVVFDPVGAGTTSFRTRTSLHILAEIRPTILRGNASEVRALALGERGTRGVDSVHLSEETVPAAQELHKRYGCVVSISGATDVIVGDGVIRVQNGHPMMPRVTGMGCTATALTGAFAAVNPSATFAAAHAMAINGIAGEIAGAKANGPGSFQVCFLDALAGIGAPDLEKSLKMDMT